jgi:hypothetical protein
MGLLYGLMYTTLFQLAYLSTSVVSVSMVIVCNTMFKYCLCCVICWGLDFPSCNHSSSQELVPVSSVCLLT